MAENILSLNVILTSPQPTTFDRVEWGNGPLADTQKQGDTPKLRHFNRRGEGKTDGVENGRRRKRCSLFQRI